jgi:hypothetical protein
MSKDDLTKAMNQAIRQKAVVKPGGIIEIQSPELTTGATADVIVILETSLVKKASLTSLIGTAKGSFSTHQAADEFVSRERDSWS